MKLFVLGGSGLIGKELIKKASVRHKIFATYNNRDFTMSNITTLKFLFPNDLEKLEFFLIKESPDVVINLIGISELNYCENNKKKIYELNTEFTEKISNICNKINSKFIHISTDYVFDGKDGNYKEEDITNPINYYGYTKQISEIKALNYSNSVVIRTSFIYDSKLETNFLKFIFKKLDKGEEVIIFDDVFATPIFLDELIEGILKIIDSNEIGIFHIVGNECVSRFNFAKIIARKLELNEKLIIPKSVKIIEKKILRPQNSCLNNNKIKEILGVKFSKLEENLEKIKKNNSI